MKIKLPWKRLGHDGQKHRATLEITYYHTQMEELMRSADTIKEERDVSGVQFEKKKRSGLRKCPGHKAQKGAIYDADGCCSICKGYKKEV